jgi:serine/threonine protein phosphatase PrpC
MFKLLSMSAQANGIPLNNNTTSAGDASLSTPQFEGVYQQSKKGPILSEDRSLCKTKGINFVRAVFDGHGGVPGAAYAQIGCDVTASFFDSINWNDITPSILKSMMPGLFRRIDMQCLEESRTRTVLEQIQAASHTTGKYYDMTRGGTTGTITFGSFCPLTHRRYVLTAHVGDSSAALVCGDVAIQLDAGNHGIDNLLEEQRIEADFQHRRNVAIAAGQSPHAIRRVSLTYTGGSQAFVQQDGVTIPNPQVAINKWGQRRQPCNVNDDLSGYANLGDYSLAMVRAIADFAMREGGVVALPTVSVMYLNPEQNGQIVVASDGLWDGVFLTRAQKVASRYPQFRCISEMIAESNSIDTFGTMAFGQIRSAFGSNYDDITVVVGNVPTHAECLASHLAEVPGKLETSLLGCSASLNNVPKSRPARSGVPCNVLHVYDCYDPEEYDRDIEAQFPAPVEVIVAPVKVNVITVADIIGPLMEAVKRERSNRYGKAPSVRASLHRACKEISSPYYRYRVNQPRK